MQRNAEIDLLRELFSGVKPVDRGVGQPMVIKKFLLEVSPDAYSELSCVGFNAETRVLVLSYESNGFVFDGGIVEHYAFCNGTEFTPLYLRNADDKKIVFDRR